MKAFILAAGLGTRLRPLTEDRPKVMLEVGGEKILERTIRQLKRAGITDLVINTHYFPEAVTAHFGNGETHGVKIEYSHEPKILGTAGGLKNAEDKFAGEKEFLVIYGDNVFYLDFKKIAEAPLNAASVLMLFDRGVNPNSGAAGGVAELDHTSHVIGFHEGVDRPDIPYVNGGVYKFGPQIFNLIPVNTFYDFGRDVFPKMLKDGHLLKGYVLHPDEALFGIDTIEYLEKANQYFNENKLV